jgi:hypothetical protein
LARSCQVANSLGDRHGEPGDVITAHLDIAGVDTGPKVQAHVLGTGEDLDGAA